MFKSIPNLIAMHSKRKTLVSLLEKILEANRKNKTCSLTQEEDAAFVIHVFGGKQVTV